MKNLAKKIRITGLSTFILALAIIFNSCDLDENQVVTNFTNLTWEDNFDTNGSPNSTRWTYDIGDGTAEGIPGWGNNELQYYTDRPENVVIEDGMLKITAIKEPYEGRNYTSARILTKGGLFQQAYGRFEARIKLPWGQGLWPAFWLLGTNADVWPQRGEIDIMGNRGSEPTIVHGSVHGPGYSGGEAIMKPIFIFLVSSGVHIISNIT